MGACLCKSKAKDPKEDLSDIKAGRPAPVAVPETAVQGRTSTASDVTPKRKSDSSRSKGLVGRVFGHDSEEKLGRGSKGSNRAKQSKEGVGYDQKLQGLSSMELVEQYTIDASILISSAARIDQLLRERQAGVPSQDSQRTESGPMGGTNVSSISADSRAHLSHTRSPSANSIGSPISPLPAPSIGSLLQLDPSIAAIAKDFENGRMLQVRQGLKRWCTKHDLQLKQIAPFHKILGFKVSELEKHCAKIEECLEGIRDDSGYSTARDDGDLKVLYKCVKGKIHHIKMESVLPHALERPLSLAREFDLMNTWNHYIVESQLLLAPSIWRSYVYAAMWMPFPFPQMECLGTGRGYDLSLEDKSLLVAIESIEDDELPPEATPVSHKKSKKRHRANVMPGSAIRLEALPPKEDGTPQTKGTILQIVNPHVPHVPAFIVNFVLGVLAPFAHKQIVKLLKDEFDTDDKPFPRRMAANPELYDRVKEVVKEGLAHHYGYTAAGDSATPQVMVV